MELVNQQMIKNANLKILYNFIYQNRGISRAALAKMAHLSKTTVSSLVDELIERRFILDSGAADSNNVGRKPNSLQIRAGSYFVAVVTWDLGMVHVNLVDIAGEAVSEAHMQLTEMETHVSLTHKILSERVLPGMERGSLLGICVAVSAMIDREKDEVYSTTLRLAPGEEQGVAARLRALFPQYPVLLLNDTACFAYAEKVYTGILEQNFAYINFNNKGIGATLFICGTMIGGSSGFFTQFGHYSVDPEGRPCVCGNRGCLEIAMGEDLLKERITQTGFSPTLCHLDKISYADLGKAAAQGDLVAQAVIDAMAREFSIVLGNLVCLVHPRLIILGGKSQMLGGLFLERLKADLGTVGFRKMMDPLEVRYAKLDYSAYLKGAMKYFFDIHYKFSQDPARIPG